MPVQFSDLVRIAGITILITLLWAATVAFTYWDTHRRSLPAGRAFIWLVLVALLPFIGFISYLSFRVITLFLSSGVDGKNLKPRRETALKRSPERRSPQSTLIASDLAMQTVSDPKSVLQTHAELRKFTSKYVFAVSSGADQGKEFVLEHLPARIGRGPEAAIRLDKDLGVSRQHAEIYEQEGRLRIRDLKSTHGTQVNSVRIQDINLEPGDRIQIGLTVLAVKSSEE